MCVVSYDSHCWSVVKLVNLDLHLFKLFEKLLQMHLGELNTFTTVNILRGKLFEVALLHIFAVLASLFIRLEVESEFTDWCSHITSQNTLLTRR